MSVLLAGRAPHPIAVSMVAQEMGFSGGLEACRVWLEELTDRHGGVAVNVVQPIALREAHSDG